MWVSTLCDFFLFLYFPVLSKTANICLPNRMISQAHNKFLLSQLTPLVKNRNLTHISLDNAGLYTTSTRLVWMLDTPRRRCGRTPLCHHMRTPFARVSKLSFTHRAAKVVGSFSSIYAGSENGFVDGASLVIRQKRVLPVTTAVKWMAHALRDGSKNNCYQTLSHGA